MEIKNIGNKELKVLQQKIAAELTARKESNTVVINLRDEMNKCLINKITHSKWCKRVTNIDYRKANGFSIVGEFVTDEQATKKDYWKVDSLFIDCENKDGNKNYHLFILHSNGMELLGSNDSSDYTGYGYIPDGSLKFKL